MKEKQLYYRKDHNGEWIEFEAPAINFALGFSSKNGEGESKIFQSTLPPGVQAGDRFKDKDDNWVTILDKIPTHALGHSHISPQWPNPIISPRPPKKDKRITFRVTEETYDLLEILAAKSNVTLSEFMNQISLQFLNALISQSQKSKEGGSE